jgi:hypothetical protein
MNRCQWLRRRAASTPANCATPAGPLQSASLSQPKCRSARGGYPHAKPCHQRRRSFLTRDANRKAASGDAGSPRVILPETVSGQIVRIRLEVALLSPR